MYSLKSSQLKALFEEEFDLKIGTPNLSIIPICNGCGYLDRNRLDFFL